MVELRVSWSRGCHWAGRGRYVFVEPGDVCEVTCYRTATPGLVVHRKPVIYADESKPRDGCFTNRTFAPLWGPGNTWSISHLASGLALPDDHRTRAIAKSLANHLGGVLDWTQPKDVVIGQVSLVAEALAEWRRDN